MFAGLAFISCSDDDGDSAYYTTSPETETAGTYSGTWTQIEDGGDTITASGTLTFTADSAYVTVVSAECTDLEISYESVANIVYAGNRYVYSNMRSTNGFGTTFSGEISDSWVADINFSLTVKVGRKSYTYYYSFEGTRE